VQALTDLGWRDGRNIRIDYRWASGNADRLRLEAADLASLMPEAIFVQGTPGAMALRELAPTIPIVFVMVTDPIASGLVATLARPGGKITGFMNYEYALGGKLLETHKEGAVGVTRVAVIYNPANVALAGQLPAIDAAALA
jgi:putative ABC transport system substrate-binding protein